MAYEFPADVVKTTDKFSTELRQFGGISPDDIARLWKGTYCSVELVVSPSLSNRLQHTPHKVLLCEMSWCLDWRISSGEYGEMLLFNRV